MAFLAKAIVYLVTALFFLGLIGCAGVIVLSWIDIIRDGFRDDPIPKNNASANE